MVHRPQRLGEIISLMRQYKLEPKRIRMVHPRAHLEANMVLIEAMKDGKPEVRMLPPLIVYNEQGITVMRLWTYIMASSRPNVRRKEETR